MIVMIEGVQMHVHVFHCLYHLYFLGGKFATILECCFNTKTPLIDFAEDFNIKAKN